MFERYQIDWEAYHQRCQTGPCFICEIIAGNPDYPADIVYEMGLASLYSFTQ